MLLGDISNVNNNLDFIQILTAVCIVDFIFIFLAKKANIFGKQINVWYDKLGMTGVLLDVLIISLVLISTRYIFNFYKIEYKPEYFILIALAVQLIHDILLYLLFIEPAKRGDNLVMDIYKDYAEENGSNILLGDASMVLLSCLIAMVLKNRNLSDSIVLLILVIYLIPYLIYSKSN
jgi:hypothetical protein